MRNTEIDDCRTLGGVVRTGRFIEWGDGTVRFIPDRGIRREESGTVTLSRSGGSLVVGVTRLARRLGLDHGDRVHVTIAYDDTQEGE